MSFFKSNKKFAKSQASADTPQDPSIKKKITKRLPFSKSKNRLSSLLSSSSLSSDQQGRILRSKDERSVSASPSLATERSSLSGGRREELGSRDVSAPTTPHEQEMDVIATQRPVVTAEPSEPVLVSRQSSSPAKPTRQRSVSMYSEWSEMGADSSDSEYDCYQTPSEGLSEVDEDEEGEIGEPESSSVLQRSQASQSNPQEAHGIHRSVPTASASTIPAPPSRSLGPSQVVDQGAVLQDDLRLCAQILTLFLTSRMRDAEELCYNSDPDRQHMYLLSAGSIMNGLKGMMTFDAADLSAALEICRGTATLAQSLRRPVGSLAARLSGLVKSTSVSAIGSMTTLERHAELVYAETSLMKAVLAIVSGGDWMGLIKEALNMRTAHSIYKSLDLYLKHVDRDGFDPTIDNDFRSGVVLGTGMSSLMLSLLPGKVLRVAEMFGFGGDRRSALQALMSAGGWSAQSEGPSVTAEQEGIRRPVCDMILLTYHLVISVLVPVGDVDIPMARKILRYNLDRYPDGVFFLYFKSRLHTSQCEPVKANATLQAALELRLEYLQLQHMCLWDYACNSLMLLNWRKALECFRILKTESNWSKATYMYATAACMTELVNGGSLDQKIEATAIMASVSTSTRKIAGKSLPIEKFVSRKARKFASQGDYLLLPSLELAYIFGSLSFSPADILLSQSIPFIETALDSITSSTPDSYRDGRGNYWDDFCLCHFLRGVSYSYAAYPRQFSSIGTGSQTSAEISRHAREAEASFAHVLANGVQVKLDHWVIYHAHFELGQFYAKHGDPMQARHHFDLIMSGKPLEVDHHAAKSQGKYSMESALQLKTHAALQSLS